MNTSKIKDNVFPLVFSRGEPNESGEVCLYDVEFIADFGPIKKGNTFSCVSVESGNGVIRAYGGSEEDELFAISFKAVPAN